MAREFHHVVAAAAFLGGSAELLAHVAGIEIPALAIARAAGRVTSLADDLMPEIIGDGVIAIIASEFVSPRRANHFRNIRVCVQTLQFVAPLGQRVKEFLVVKPSGESEIFFFAGHRI